MRHLRDNQLALNGSQPGELCVMATGGGAYKYYDKIHEALGVDVLREDEMECLIIGKHALSAIVYPMRANGEPIPQALISSLRRSLEKSLPTLNPTPCTS